MEALSRQRRELALALRRTKGIQGAEPLDDRHRSRILSIEEDARDRSLMGLGEVVNVGVQEVLACDTICVALTSMVFDWGCHASLVLRKGKQIVGEEVRDPQILEELSGKPNVWFLHRNFVVYRDRIQFPSDIMKKVCHFEIPSMPADWCAVDAELFPQGSLLGANPCTPCDLFLKETYFHGLDERGLGTILVGGRGAESRGD